MYCTIDKGKVDECSCFLKTCVSFKVRVIFDQKDKKNYIVEEFEIRIIMETPLVHIEKIFPNDQRKLQKYYLERFKASQKHTNPRPKEGRLDDKILEHIGTHLRSKYAGAKLQKREATLALWQDFFEKPKNPSKVDIHSTPSIPPPLHDPMNTSPKVPAIYSLVQLQETSVVFENPDIETPLQSLKVTSNVTLQMPKQKHASISRQQVRVGDYQFSGHLETHLTYI